MHGIASIARSHSIHKVSERIIVRLEELSRYSVSAVWRTGLQEGYRTPSHTKDAIYARKDGENTLLRGHANCGRPCLLSLLIVLVVLSSLAVPVHGASVDLTVDSVWLENASNPGQAVASVAPGDQFNIVASVKNIGDAPASGYYIDVYYDSDYGRGGPDNIAPGEVQIWYVGPLTAQDGTHTTKWIVDPDNQIAELDENNNQREYVFTVGSQTVTTTTTSSSTSSTTELTSTSTSSTAESTSALTSSTTQSTSTSTSSTESIVSTTTTTTTSSSSTSQIAPATLTLAPVSGPAGTVISVSGSNYQGTTCILTPVPPGLFTSQTCSIVAGVLTGSFTVDSGAPAGLYSVSVQTNAGQSDSATSSFTVIPSYTVTFYTDPSSATVTVDGASRTDGTTGTYLSGARVHVIANLLSGYSFLNWETSGVSVDSTSSQDTYVTVSGNGWLKAHFMAIRLPGPTLRPALRMSTNTYASQFPVLAASDSYLYVAWSDSSPVAKSGGQPEVWLRVSSNSGASFGSAIRISTNTGASVSPSVAASGSYVYVAWSDNTPVSGSGSDYEVWMCTRSNNGGRFGSAIRISVNTGWSGQPSVAASGNYVYVAWSDSTPVTASGGMREVWMRVSSNNGRSFGPAIRITKNSGESLAPSVAAAGSYVYVAWQDDTPVTGSGSAPEIWMRVSSNYGASLGPAVRISYKHRQLAGPVRCC